MTDATELDVAAIRARCEAATDGPWLIDSLESGEYGLFIDRDPDAERLGCGGRQVAGWLTEANAEFIAHARADLPAALDEIERLRAALDEARAEVERLTRDRAAWRSMQEEAARYWSAWEASSKRNLARAEAAESALAAVRALADECASSPCIHLNEMWGRLRAVLPAPTSPERSEQ
jgi:hypothetical protein